MAKTQAEKTAYNREWKKKNPDKVKAQKRRKRFRTYGITEEDFNDMWDAQGGRCAICGSSDPANIDHCHTTGDVRGLLCHKCNFGIGQFNDNPDLLRAAIDYLGGGA